MKKGGKLDHWLCGLLLCILPILTGNPAFPAVLVLLYLIGTLLSLASKGAILAGKAYVRHERASHAEAMRRVDDRNRMAGGAWEQAHRPTREQELDILYRRYLDDLRRIDSYAWLPAEDREYLKELARAGFVEGQERLMG